MDVRIAAKKYVQKYSSEILTEDEKHTDKFYAMVNSGGYYNK